MSKKSVAKKSDTAPTVAVPSAGTMRIPLSRIVADKEFNARTQGLDDKSIAEFAETIKREGMLQPVVVEPLENGDYFLKAGFRRYTAAKLLGWDSIDATVKMAEGADKKEQQVNRYFTNLAENVARANLTPYDLAMRCKLIKRENGISGSDIAKRIGKNVGYINNLLAIVGEGEKGEHKGATLHPDIIRQWQEECSWGDDDKRTKVCLTDTLRRWLRFSHAEQLAMFNRAMFISKGGDAEEYDRQQAAASGDGKGAGDKDDGTKTAEVVRASKSQLEKALEAAKHAKKESKSKEQITRLNGVIEGLSFALGVAEGKTNKIADVIAIKDGKVTESAIPAPATN